MIKAIIAYFKKCIPPNDVPDQDIKNISPISIARWSINQFVACPFCKHDNNIIELNLKRKVNRGRMTVNQKQVSKYDVNKFEYQDVSVNIPVPPYFGALMETTENLDERLDCEKCGNTIHIHDANWNFGNW